MLFGTACRGGLLSLVFFALGLTRHDFDLVDFDLLRIVEFEFDVLEDEGPDFVTEAVGVEMTLKETSGLSI